MNFTILFVRNRLEVEKLVPLILEKAEYDSLIWIVYPKGSSRIKTDINRDILWEMLKIQNIRPVAQIAIDDIWSALRFRPIINN